MPAYKRVLLKLSGEALGSEKGIFDFRVSRNGWPRYRLYECGSDPEHRWYHGLLFALFCYGKTGFLFCQILEKEIQYAKRITEDL